MVFRDWLTVELNKYLEYRYSNTDTRVVYERLEEIGEPEPGPSIYEIDLPEQLIRVLEKRGISRLYRFQYEAYKYIVNGFNTVIVAGTGTGKTEAFFIPIAKKLITGSHRHNPQVLLLYPTKALARDQVKRFTEYSVYGKLGVNIYDGDTPENLRRRIASNPSPIVVSNPDMLHVGLIYSPYIRKFIELADTMVFDELHVYEGVLGSHIHHLVHRLKLFRGNAPQFIASSATIGNPKELAEMLFEEEFREVYGSIARKGTAVHIFISSGFMSRWSIAASIAKFLAENNLRFIMFVDSQQLAEVLASIIEFKHGVNVAVHRAGIPYDVRRDVENKLRDGILHGVVSTPTLELGIDIGTLDAVIMASPPPSYTKYLQRAGRAGRRKKGYVITVFGDDPIDTYYIKNPPSFFNQKLTPSIIEPLNEEVIKMHFVSYLLQVGKANISRIPWEWRRVIEDLVIERLIRKIGSYISVNYQMGRKYVSERGGIRAQGEVVGVVDIDRNQLMATRELPIAVLELYPGAIYFHAKKPYEVININLSEKKAYLKEIRTGSQIYTRPLYSVDVMDYSIQDERSSSLGLRISYAKILVEIKVEGYIVKDLYSGETYALRDLNEPLTYRYITRGVLIKLPRPIELDELSSIEGFHAIEHGLIICSRVTCGTGLTDLGGVSYPSGDIVIYDSSIGGTGASKLLYAKLERTIDILYDLMANCSCEDGCPRCIFSPYCGNNNKMLSKKKALYIIDNLLLKKVVAKAKPLEDRYGKPLV